MYEGTGLVPQTRPSHNTKTKTLCSSSLQFLRARNVCGLIKQNYGASLQWTDRSQSTGVHNLEKPLPQEGKYSSLKETEGGAHFVTSLEHSVPSSGVEHSTYECRYQER